MSKESTRSRHSEEFKVEAAQLVCSSPERSICQLTVEMMSRLVSNQCQKLWCTP
jgi:transposase-like protein